MAHVEGIRRRLDVERDWREVPLEHYQAVLDGRMLLKALDQALAQWTQARANIEKADRQRGRFIKSLNVLYRRLCD